MDRYYRMEEKSTGTATNSSQFLSLGTGTISALIQNPETINIPRICKPRSHNFQVNRHEKPAADAFFPNYRLREAQPNLIDKKDVAEGFSWEQVNQNFGSN